MGTRADFYIGKGKSAQWLGSIAHDGDEWAARINDNEPDNIIAAQNADEYKTAVEILLGLRDDSTTPEMIWPWPWDDSTNTDYAYCFVDGKIEVFQWGRKLGSDEEVEWPNFASQSSASPGSKRSGTICLYTT